MLNQGSRNLQLHVPCFGDGVLIPVEARAKEAVSQSFLCSIECISNNLNVDGHALLGNNAALVFLDKEGSKRYLNGVISQFTSHPPIKSAKSVNSHAIRRYHLQLIPQFELLDHGSNCQFFKDMTVPEIFQTHCKKLGFHNFDMTGLSQKYKPLTYKTQFNETNFNFLSRILEEAGISYYYQHSKDEHTLMLVDNPLKFKNSQITVNSVHADETDFFPVTSLGAGTSALFSWETKQTVSPLQTCMSPLNDSQPNHWDYPTALSTGRNKVAMRPGLYCIMHYPNSLTDRDSRHQAQSALTNALAAEQMACEGSGNCIHFSAGHTFLLDPEKTGPWLITEIHHHAFDYSCSPDAAKRNPGTQNSETWNPETWNPGTRNPGTRNPGTRNPGTRNPGEQNPGSEETKTAGYSNTFKHINTQKTHYAPKRTIKKALIPDLQPAFVTGPEGYEKAVYTNPLGQVQVRFPWDRSAQNSCFIDVKHSGAGSDFGAQFIPGIGQEVLVSYVGGDLDMPMIVGSVANGKTAPACNLSENPNLTWIKSNSAGHSTDHSAGQGHHILFDDTPGKEQLTLQSQKDYIEEILGDSTLTIEGDDEIRIDGNDSLHALSEALKLQGKTLTLSGGGSELIISEHGIELKGSAASGGRVELCSKGAGPMKPVARLGDKYACAKRTAGTPHHGGPIVSAAAGITVNKLGIARQGDKGHCRITTDHIKEGIAGILVAGKPVARLNHAMKHGGVITSASENVFVGERTEVKSTPALPVAPLTRQDTLNLLYETGTKTFYALTDKEMKDFDEETEFFKHAMENLTQANEENVNVDNTREHSIAHAKKQLNQSIPIAFHF